MPMVCKGFRNRCNCASMPSVVMAAKASRKPMCRVCNITRKSPEMPIISQRCGPIPARQQLRLALDTGSPARCKASLQTGAVTSASASPLLRQVPRRPAGLPSAAAPHSAWACPHGPTPRTLRQAKSPRGPGTPCQPSSKPAGRQASGPITSNSERCQRPGRTKAFCTISGPIPAGSPRVSAMRVRREVIIRTSDSSKPGKEFPTFGHLCAWFTFQGK